MAGKLLYSRVLQNKMQKSQAAEQEPVQQKPKSQFYVDRSEGYPADRKLTDNRYADNRSFGRDERSPDPKGGDGNKIRRGPGRRIAKEKRMTNMDPALLQKYTSLPESLQEKVNATIQICYQQYMADRYKNPGKAEQSHYDVDVEIDGEGEVQETQLGFDE